MRLGILGPAEGDVLALARRAQLLLDDAEAERVIYAADDDALELVVRGWAQGIVGPNPSEEALFDRAAVGCADANSHEIDEFVARERARLRLRVFESLPEAPNRTIEILDGRVVVFVYDKSNLDEEDIAAASVL